MGTIQSILAAASISVTSIGAWNSFEYVADYFQPSGTPSQQPGPKNPSPRPSKQNPTPRPSNPTPRPDNQNPTPDPNDPGAAPRQPGETTPNRDGSRPSRTRANDPNRNQRPFAFQSPDMEGRFNVASRRLVQMEQRMQRSQTDVLKRLGEARQLSGERQTAALFDVLQQMLRDQADLQRYLTQSRTLWTGDIDIDDQLQDTLQEDDTASVPTDDQPPARNDR